MIKLITSLRMQVATALAVSALAAFASIAPANAQGMRPDPRVGQARYAEVLANCPVYARSLGDATTARVYLAMQSPQRYRRLCDECKRRELAGMRRPGFGASIRIPGVINVGVGMGLGRGRHGKGSANRGAPTCPANWSFNPSLGKCVEARVHDIPLTAAQRDTVSRCLRLETRKIVRGDRLVTQQRCVEFQDQASPGAAGPADDEEPQS